MLLIESGTVREGHEFGARMDGAIWHVCEALGIQRD